MRRPWLATEYVAGPSLERAVGGAGPLPEASVGVLASRLADALAALHSIGLVHRDLKPSNVMLAPDGPRLLDFGIARTVDATRITRTGLAVGTPAFMSPEQAKGIDGGPASDVCSLACVLTFAATGEGPFGRGENPVTMLLRVSEDEPNLIGMPATLRAELAPCLAKDPADRPSARQLADTFEHWVDPPPSAAWPPPVVSELTPPRPQSAPGAIPGVFAPAPMAFDIPAGLTPTSTALRSLSGLFRTGRGPGRAALALLALPVIAALALAAVFLVPWSGATAPNPAAAPSPPPAVALRPVRLGAPMAVQNGGSAYQPVVSPDGGRLFIDGIRGIAVVDAHTRALIQMVKPRQVPDGPMFCSPDGRLLYVVEFTQVEIIDLSLGRPAGTIPLRQGLHSDADISRDGRWIVLLGKALSDTTQTLTVIDTAVRTVRDIPLPGLTLGDDVVVTEDGRRAYTHQLLGPMLQVDLDTGVSTRNPSVQRVDKVALSADGRELYVMAFQGLITTFRRAHREPDSAGDGAEQLLCVGRRRGGSAGHELREDAPGARPRDREGAGLGPDRPDLHPHRGLAGRSPPVSERARHHDRYLHDAAVTGPMTSAVRWLMRGWHGVLVGG
jgi:protein kinase-like protein